MDYWQIKSNLSIEARQTFWEKVATLLGVFWPKAAVDESRKSESSCRFGKLEPAVGRYTDHHHLS